MNLKYRPEIDGLRAIAVLSVIIYHAKIKIFGYRLLEGGFLGVDVFFVISGYLITSIIFKEFKETGKFSFLNFYERRIRRIIPALFFVILVSLPFAWFFILPDDYINFSKSIIFSLGFLSNYFFHFSGQEYISVDSLYIPLLHTWSLSVEEQYYLIFPIILLGFLKFFRSYILILLGFLFLISFIFANIGSLNYPSLNFYSLHTRLWEIMAGSLISYFHINYDYKFHEQKFHNISTLLGIVLIILPIILYDESIRHPSFYTLPTIIGTSLVIWFSSKNNFVIQILSSKIFVSIGLISYSLYLWHYPIFAFSRIRYTGFVSHGYLKEIIILILVVIFSLVTYFFIEKPARNRQNRFKFVSIPISFVLILFLGYSSFIIKNNGYETRYFNTDIYKFSKQSYLEQFNFFTENYNYDNYSNDKRNVLIVGNSFSLNLLQVLSDSDLNQRFYFNHAGPIKRKANNNYQVHYFLNYLKKNVAFTDGDYKNFLDHLNKQYKESDIIILGTLWSEQDINSIEEINNIVVKDKKKIILFDQSVCSKPLLSYQLNRFDHFVFINKRLPTKEELSELEKRLFKDYQIRTCYGNVVDDVNSKIEKITLKNNINLIQMKNIYCDIKNKKCPMLTSEGYKIYFDYGHLTRKGAELFSEKIGKNKKLINFLN